MILYTNFIEIENNSLDIHETKVMAYATLYGKNISDIDEDIESIKEASYIDLNNEIDNLIKFGIYKDMTCVLEDISNNKLSIYALASYVDISKCIEWYGYDRAINIFNNHNDYFNNCAYAVQYRIDITKDARRYECYGDLINTHNYRYELSDNIDNNLYAFGDKVVLKFSIDGYNNAIITMTPNKRPFYIGRVYDILLPNGTIITTDYSDSIHHDDIVCVIGSDKEIARKAVKSSFEYTDEYKKEVAEL